MNAYVAADKAKRYQIIKECAERRRELLEESEENQLDFNGLTTEDYYEYEESN